MALRLIAEPPVPHVLGLHMYTLGFIKLFRSQLARLTPSMMLPSNATSAVGLAKPLADGRAMDVVQ